MEPLVIRPNTKKQPIETKLMALVGHYVIKEFDGSGIFLRKVYSRDWFQVLPVPDLSDSGSRKTTDPIPWIITGR